MTRYAALLRGINVGGKNALPMATLRQVAEDLGFDDVATYVNSGNLFLTTDAAEDAVVRALRSGIEQATGLDVPVVVRSHDELVRVVADNPLPVPEDPRLMHVVFLAAAAELGLDPADFPGEDAAAHGREIYAAYPNGFRDSRLAQALARKGGKDGTDRNWRTVLTLVERTA